MTKILIYNTLTALYLAAEEIKIPQVVKTNDLLHATKETFHAFLPVYIIIIIGGITIYWIKKKIKQQEKEKSLKNEQDKYLIQQRNDSESISPREINTPIPLKRKLYWKNKSILTEDENIFYQILKEKLSLEHTVLCKVRMADIIYIDKTLKDIDQEKYKREFYKIASKHFDFVICNTQTLEIQRVIELDGWTHRKESQAEADKFKDEACKEAGITIVRIDYQEMNYPDKMLEKIVRGY